MAKARAAWVPAAWPRVHPGAANPVGCRAEQGQVQGGSQPTAKPHSGPVPNTAKAKAVWAPAAWHNGHGGAASPAGSRASRAPRVSGDKQLVIKG